jgi:hypothetical protein
MFVRPDPEFSFIYACPLWVGCGRSVRDCFRPGADTGLKLSFTICFLKRKGFDLAMTPGESKFREFEIILHPCVRDAGAQLQAFDIQVKDLSVRHHQRGEYLRWDYEFTRSWELELETAQVRLNLFFLEPVTEIDPVKVQKWCCAEQFRPGQISRIREVIQGDVLMPAVTSSELGDFIIREVRNAARIVGQEV